MNQKEIIEQFPILKRKINGKRLVYLDNSATTQKPKRVINALSRFYKKHNANIHRGLHTLSNESTDLYEGSHEVAANFWGTQHVGEIVFTRNTTESINLVANAWGRKFLSQGDVVVISEMEHHSNVIPWQMLAQEKGIKVEWVSVKKNGELDMDDFKAILKRNPRKIKMVSLVHISNVLGTINPLKKIADLTHEAGGLFMVDAAQSVARFKLDVQKLGIDFMALSSHKMYGPTGIGVLYGRQELLEQMDPWMGGGDMIRRVNKAEFTVNDLPWKFEAGTPNIADGAVFQESIKFIEEIGLDWIIEHETKLMEYILKELGKLDWITIYGPKSAEKKMGAIAFSVEGIHPHDLATLLDDKAIAIRAGHHCAMPLHIQLGFPATARASLAVYNTRDDIDELISGLKYARKKFV